MDFKYSCKFWFNISSSISLCFWIPNKYDLSSKHWFKWLEHLFQWHPYMNFYSYQRLHIPYEKYLYLQRKILLHSYVSFERIGIYSRRERWWSICEIAAMDAQPLQDGKDVESQITVKVHVSRATHKQLLIHF